MKKRPLRIHVLAAAVASACILPATSPRAEACLMLNGTADQDYLNRGAEFQGRVGFLQINVPDAPDQPGFASVTFISPWYAITSAHLVTEQAGSIGRTFQIGTGSNFLTGRGTVVDVESVLVFPGYVYPQRSGPDIAILRLSQPLPGITPAVIGSTSPGQVVGAAGFGFAFRPSDPIPTSRDGNRRGWDGRVTSLPPIDSSGTYYQSTRFSAFDGVPLCGKVLGGDSGGGVFNASGQLVGLNTAQSGNGGEAGTSIYLNLSQPEVLAWITANTPPVCPADIGSQGGIPGGDGSLDNNDFVVFIDTFFAQSPVADKGQQGGIAGADGLFDNNDFIVFIDQFFAGCG